MPKRSLAGVSDDVLEHGLESLARRDRVTTADLLAHIAEHGRRRLYRRRGYPSMFQYCVHRLRMSEDVAYKRIRAARELRRFPAIYEMVEDGRVNVSTIVLLAPYLTEANAGELLAAAAHGSKREVELLLAQRFPRPDLPTRIEPLAAPAELRELAPGPVPEIIPAPIAAPVSVAQSLAATGAPGAAGVGEATSLAPAPPSVPTPSVRITPLSPGRFGFQTTLDQEAHDLLRYAQDLLGHRLAPNDANEVLKRALRVYVAQLEKQKFAATDQPRAGRSRNPDSRHIPAEVKRAVWKRDGGRCTFVSAQGHRCTERRGLEFDHVREYARGGAASVSNIRLRCRPHNQHEAEETYGPEFMRHQRLRRPPPLEPGRCVG